MATTSKFDFVAALKKSVVKKEPRFIRAADVELHGKWKKKYFARHNMVKARNLKPKKNAASSSRW